MTIYFLKREGGQVPFLPKSPRPYQSTLKGGNLNLYLFLVPSAPRGFTLTTMVDRSPDTLLASWMVPEPANGIIIQFNINCTPSLPFQPLNFTMNNDSVFSTTLRNLSAFTTYTCFITASTSVGEGPPSNSDTAMTDEDGETFILHHYTIDNEILYRHVANDLTAQH